MCKIVKLYLGSSDQGACAFVRYCFTNVAMIWYNRSALNGVDGGIL
ncbi:hypothetical protein X953_08530 [Virgibacillus sp. SK37]|nr:hypothetical protein X953_08530 [Virgibacillus sp. SK37]